MYVCLWEGARRISLEMVRCPMGASSRIIIITAILLFPHRRPQSLKLRLVVMRSDSIFKCRSPEIPSTTCLETEGIPPALSIHGIGLKVWFRHSDLHTMYNVKTMQQCFSFSKFVVVSLVTNVKKNIRPWSCCVRWKEEGLETLNLGGSYFP